MNNFKFGLIFVLIFNGTECLAQNSKLSIEPYEFKSASGEIVQAELGKFSVQENRLISSSRLIELHFVRFKSTNPNPGNPIVYLAGGPGGSGISAARGNRFELFMALTKVADVIAFDQRGTGLSNHIPNCKEKAVFDYKEPGTYENYISKLKQSAKKCLSFWKNKGVNIDGYTTIESSSDLEELRTVLDVEKINLWGISYGSHLAFDFIKRYEHSVDKVVLAGLEGPDQSIKLPKFNQNFLKVLSSKVKQDTAANIAYPNLLKLMERVLAKLKDKPVIIEIKNPRSGKPLEVGISELDVQLVVSFMLTKNPKDSVKLPLIFAQMDSGDYTQMAQMVMGLKSYAGRARAMPLIMDAASGISDKRWAKVKKQSKKALLGRATNFPYPDIAVGLELPKLDKSFRKNPKSLVPALFFSGTLDGRTYIESAKELKKGFKNAKHVILDGAGHDLFMSTSRVKELILDFFNNKEVKSQTIVIEIPKFKILE